MAESIHQKLSRVRKPHVHITYEVFTDGANVVRELPFVVGVMGDFSGNPTAPLKHLRDREFLPIDRDNFDGILKGMTPGLNFEVPNKLKDDNTTIKVALTFEKMEDFSPAAVAKQVPALQDLLNQREQLKALLDKSERSDVLEGLLEKIIQNAEEVRRASGTVPPK